MYLIKAIYMQVRQVWMNIGPLDVGVDDAAAEPNAIGRRDRSFRDMTFTRLSSHAK
jgi:hypothetical protein